MELILGRCEILETGLHEAFIKDLQGDSDVEETRSCWKLSLALGKMTPTPRALIQNNT